MEIRTKAAQFIFWEYLFQFLVLCLFIDVGDLKLLSESCFYYLNIIVVFKQAPLSGLGLPSRVHEFDFFLENKEYGPSDGCKIEI